MAYSVRIPDGILSMVDVDLKCQIDDATITIKDARERLIELGVEVPFKINTPNY